MLNNKIKILVLLATVLIQLLLSFVLISFVFKPRGSARESDDKIVEKQEEDEANKLSIGEIYMIEDLVINPSGTRGRRFISVTLGVELNTGHTGDEIKVLEPRLIDMILTLLSGKGMQEFIDILNRENIRQEILNVIKQNTPEDVVKQIYITKFIIQ